VEKSTDFLSIAFANRSDAFLYDSLYGSKDDQIEHLPILLFTLVCLSTLVGSDCISNRIFAYENGELDYEIQLVGETEDSAVFQ